jgi:hypothetical protein
MRKSIVVWIAVLAAAALVSGCVGNESYPNNPKPPAVLNITVFVGEADIAVSPEPFGAGPARFIITNQTGTNQKVLLSTDQFDRETLVGKGQTVNFKQTVEPGDLTISSSNTAADAKTVEVGPQRPTSQHDLNQP